MNLFDQKRNESGRKMTSSDKNEVIKLVVSAVRSNWESNPLPSSSHVSSPTNNNVQDLFKPIKVLLERIETYMKNPPLSKPQSWIETQQLLFKQVCDVVILLRLNLIVFFIFDYN